MAAFDLEATAEAYAQVSKFTTWAHKRLFPALSDTINYDHGPQTVPQRFHYTRYLSIAIRGTRSGIVATVVSPAQQYPESDYRLGTLTLSWDQIAAATATKPRTHKKTK